jgi:hypothetical protein
MPGLLDGTETVGIEKEVGRSFRPPGLEHPRADSERGGIAEIGGQAMTREEAIECLKTIQRWTPDWDDREDGLSYWDAIDMALSALRPVSREQLSEFKTCDLVDELRKREGVETHIAEPYQDVTVSVNGPAVVLVVID